MVLKIAPTTLTQNGPRQREAGTGRLNYCVQLDYYICGIRDKPEKVM